MTFIQTPSPKTGRACGPVSPALGLTWTQDVLRHSFGTYYYNLTHDLNQVSHDMGNSTVICKSHYVREVKKNWTGKCWGLRPQTSSQ
jgi:hypothetical protein